MIYVKDLKGENAQRKHCKTKKIFKNIIELILCWLSIVEPGA